MGIHAIDEQGNLTWHCPHIAEDADQPCASANTAHVSHEHIKWHGSPGAPQHHHTVSLPPCATCGAQTFLKVHFTARELRAPNMLDAQGAPTKSHAMAQRHMQLAQQMDAFGKKRPGQEQQQ